MSKRNDDGIRIENKDEERTSSGLLVAKDFDRLILAS